MNRPLRTSTGITALLLLESATLAPALFGQAVTTAALNGTVIGSDSAGLGMRR
jgi:hypothetical protein